MADLIKLPLEEKQSAKKALLKIRFSLVVEKIKSPTITKGNLKKIVDEAKQELKDSVKEALDRFFEEYLPTNEKDNGDKKLEENNSEQPKYEEDGMNKGTSYVKRDKHHNSGGVNSNMSEAA